MIDEGHRAKNINTQIRKTIKEFEVERMKIILTGTPIQNNLNELYSLVDIVNPNLLGTPSQFTYRFSNPIETGIMKESSDEEANKAEKLILKLRGILMN